MRLRTQGIALLLLLTPALGLAQAYRWVDEKGKVHYTQTPPPKGDYGVVAPPPPSPGRSPNVEELSDYAGSLGGSKPADPQQAATDKARKQAEREARCANARQRSAYMKDDGRYYVPDAKGDRSYLSSKQIDQHRADARAAIDQNCN
ncbi:DUF4124 domain-containing protein [Solimonas sp. K1W22B-7]|uniref:DUF4124 domain-containing protein n=1 Tax=Solimonas sp. K1W22B-7 TaxID=2303331 RepID=UPI000E3314D1|nr:DUF4124 domain-containing protein [Solimonas sp. K1W22B-7]AXQ29216.1 DUF4124 domain-containing protein [Solimonas sp. K1W22B-7]